ncbi:hypothetical protein, partial [Nocardia asiatica]
AARFTPYLTARALVVVAGVGTMLSAAALSTGPWRSAEGYMGGSVLVQLPALLAIIAVGIAVLPQRAEQPRGNRTDDPDTTAVEH